MIEDIALVYIVILEWLVLIHSKRLLVDLQFEHSSFVDVLVHKLKVKRTLAQVDTLELSTFVLVPLQEVTIEVCQLAIWLLSKHIVSLTELNLTKCSKLSGF